MIIKYKATVQIIITGINQLPNTSVAVGSLVLPNTANCPFSKNKPTLLGLIIFWKIKKPKASKNKYRILKNR